MSSEGRGKRRTESHESGNSSDSGNGPRKKGKVDGEFEDAEEMDLDNNNGIEENDDNAEDGNHEDSMEIEQATPIEMKIGSADEASNSLPSVLLNALPTVESKQRSLSSSNQSSSTSEERKYKEVKVLEAYGHYINTIQEFEEMWPSQNNYEKLQQNVTKAAVLDSIFGRYTKDYANAAEGEKTHVKRRYCNDKFGGISFGAFNTLYATYEQNHGSGTGWTTGGWIDCSANDQVAKLWKYLRENKGNIQPSTKYIIDDDLVKDAYWKTKEDSRIDVYEINGLEWPTGGLHFVKNLIVRRATRQVWELTWNDACKTHFRITGSPDIGKSVSFIGYALIQLAKEINGDECVILDYHKWSKVRYLLKADGTARELPEGAGKPVPSDLKKHCYVLIDPAEMHADALSILNGKKVFVIASPNNNAWKNHEKDYFYTKTMVIYSWTKEEFNTVAGQEFKVQNTDQSFSVHGGTIRLAQQPNDTESLEDVLADQRNMFLLKSLFARRLRSADAGNSKPVHRFVNMVCPSEMQDRKYETWRLEWTEEGFKQFANYLTRQNEETKLKLLQDLSPTTSMRGSSFERLMHFRLGKGGNWSFSKGKCKWSKSSLISRIKWEKKANLLNLAVVETIWSDDAESEVADQVKNLQNGNLLVIPNDVNHASVDSYLISKIGTKAIVFALQMTISERHSYDTDKLHDYLNRIKEGETKSVRVEFRYCLVGLERHRGTFELERPKEGMSEWKAFKKPRDSVEKYGIWWLALT